MTNAVPLLPEAQDAFAANGALSKASRLYRDAGLRLPPVPRELAPRLTELSEWQYASAPVELTDRAGFLAAAGDVAASAEVGFGHVGHGIASWWLCYRLIRGPLAVFLRLSYGGVHTDNEAAGSFFNATVERIEELIVQAEAADAAGRIGAGRRLAVLVDFVEGSGWQMLGSEPDWQASKSPIGEAMAFLAALGTEIDEVERLQC
jgi:hypothetical protein